jgi:adenosylcobinamide-phosphate synthase
VAVTGAVAVGVAFALDAVVGEFPGRVHPVALFGRVVARVDREWTRPRLVGTLAAVGLPLIAALVCWGVVACWDVVHFAGVDETVTSVVVAAAAGIVLFSTTSVRMLLDVTREVVAATEGDLTAARSRIRALVGRDTDDLDAGALRSAAVESAAENLADGLVAPLLAFALGAQLSLAVGAAAAGWVKAVNTLDSMLGYQSKAVGRESARLDDLVMWVPARVTAVLLALAGGMVARRPPTTLTTAAGWAREPASPNSGWPMAALAAVLDVRLAKPGQYDLNPDAAFPTVAAAERGVRVVTVAAALAVLLAGVTVWI